MVTADLHVHTRNSDGRLTMSELPAAADRAGVEVVAVTDHDRFHPELTAPVETSEGLTVIAGIELRVTTPTQRVDLLGYGVRRTDGLVALVDRLQSDRIERARRIVDNVERRLGVTLSVDYEPGVGRPHIARAIAESDAPHGYTGAFEQLIGDGCPCYVAREVPSFAEGREQLQQACGVVGLAHPLRYDAPEAAIDRAGTLDAIERYYPYGRQVDSAPIDQAIETEGLLPTGGSDAHDHQLGVAGLGPDQFERVRARLPTR